MDLWFPIRNLKRAPDGSFVVRLEYFRAHEIRDTAADFEDADVGAE